MSEGSYDQPVALEAEFTRERLLRRGAGLAVGAAALGLPLAASARGAASGGVLRVAFTDGASTDNLDPALSNNTLGSGVMMSINEPLVGVDAHWNLLPLLATNWEHNAALTQWTFHLRDVNFSNGAKLTAKDVAFTINRLLNKKLGSAIYGQLAIDLLPGGIKVLGPKTIRFNLKRADAFFPLIMAQRFTGIIPSGTTSFTPQTAIGTGPFIVTAFTPGQSFELKRNPGYWQAGLPLLDGVSGVVISDQSTKVNAVLSGSADLGDPFDFGSLPTVQGNSSYKILRANNLLNYHLNFNSKKPPYNDNRVRMALKLATDRKQLLDLALAGFGRLTSDVTDFPGDSTYPPKLGIRPQDIPQARKLLKAAGHSSGIDITLFTSQAYAGMVDLATVYAKQVAPAGIRVKIQQASPLTYWSNTWLVVPAFVSYTITRHPYVALGLFFQSNSSANESSMNNKKLDKLLTDVARTGSLQEQRSMFQQANRLVADNSGSVIPAFADGLWVANKKVQGVKFDLIRLVDWKHAFLA